jgi:hypothetical protein
VTVRRRVDVDPEPPVPSRVDGGWPGVAYWIDGCKPGVHYCVDGYRCALPYPLLDGRGRVFQRSDVFDSDLDAVTFPERAVLLGNQRGPRQEYGHVR